MCRESICTVCIFIKFVHNVYIHACIVYMCYIKCVSLMYTCLHMCAHECVHICICVVLSCSLTLLSY